MGESVSFSAKEIRICYAMYNDIQLIIMAGNVKSLKTSVCMNARIE